MSILRRPICWLIKHDWLLQKEMPVAWYDRDMEKVFASLFTYQCQRCGKELIQEVKHL